MAKKISSRFPAYEWYCVHCHENLNYQSGFDDNKFTWKCTNCNYKNSISKDNLRKPYAYLKDPTPANKFVSFLQGVIRSIYSLISRTALYFLAAFVIVVGLKKTTVDHLSLGLVNPHYAEDYFCGALYMAGLIFLVTLVMYAIIKRFVGRPDSKKHFIRETFYFLRDNILYPIKTIKSLFKKTTIIDTLLSIVSLLILIATIVLLVYGCTFWI